MALRNERKALLYCVTCRTNGKMYVGITRRSLRTRWTQHCYESLRPECKFHRAVAKHGADNFDVIKLFSYNSWSEACEAEVFLIASLSLMSAGYNSTAGGEESPMRRPEIAAKVGAKNKGRKVHEDVKRRISATMKGRVFDSDHKRNLSQSATGRKMSAEAVEKMRASKIGRKQAPEVIERRRQSLLKRYRNEELSDIVSGSSAS